MQTLPDLTPENKALWDASGMSRHDLAQLLRLAIQLHRKRGGFGIAWYDLSGIAHNIHPSTPTLAEAREAARQLAGPSAEVVHAFLASLED
jgi:hypothetical protein